MFFDEEDPGTVGQAARIGDLIAIRRRVADGEPVDAADNRGWRPLHDAAHAGFANCVQFLLEEVASDPGWSSHEGRTALHLACEEGHPECVRVLLQHGADPNLQDFMQCTPLFAAVQAGSEEICRLLLEAGGNVNCQQYCGTSPLHQAAAEGMEDITKLLLQHGATLDLVEEYNITPLFSAAQFGQTACLKLLLQHAASQGQETLVDKQTEDGASPLFLAAQEGHTECVSLLLDHGADPNICTSEPKACPLLAALQFAHLSIAEALLPRTSKQTLGECDIGVFYFTTMHRDPGCTELVVRAGFDVNERQCLPEGEVYEPKVLRYFQHQVCYSGKVTPLALMTLFENPICHAEVLIRAGAHLNPRTPYEVPPLLPALDKFQLELATFFIAHGATVNLYHPKVIGNMTILVCLHYWKGLNLVLSCGAEAESLFARVQPQRLPSVDHYPANLAERMDEMSDAENEEADYENEPGVFQGCVPFWRLLAEARYVMTRRGVTVAQVLYRIMQFVGNVFLDERLQSYVDSKDEWREIANIQASPRPLTHLSRLVIRRQLGPQRLLMIDPIRALPLPVQLLDYLCYTDVLKPP